ncbi:MAG TPA: MFS transporter, partial [Ignavibacteriaceae bacterium]|nr:MFS transporter [Ignavibacteriaceae bacterium]
VWADRFDRKLLIILADSGIAAATLILAILFLTGHKAIWFLFGAASIRAAGAGIHTPAIGAFVPQIVPGEKLTRVNGIYGSIQSIIMLISPMVSAALLTFASIELIFFIDVVTATIAVAILVSYLQVPAHPKALEKKTTTYLKDMHEGINYIINHKYIKSFFIFFAVMHFLVAPVAFLTPLQVARSFGSDVWRLTSIEVLFSLGMAAGGGVMASWGGLKNKIHTMFLSMMVIGICTLAFGVIANFWIYLFFMFLIGIALPVFSTPATVLIQQKVEGNFLGRVFGVLTMISSFMMPMGMLLFGPIADSIKIELMLIATGILLFAEGFFLFGNKELIKAGEPASAPAGSEET